ncbi:MAG TPA: S53 family peptidase [Opitutaceae bacterium]|jgi:kumamolisin|nr:S53 family peptidase [Opitutaceae bacterium]
MGFLRGSILALVVTFVPAAAEADHVYSGDRHFFPDSIKMPYECHGTHVARWTLTARELAAPLNFCVTLKMRNFSELQTRLSHGEKISHDDLEANYLPTASDYTAVQDWLVSEGFAITQQDPNHTNVFAQGTIARIQDCMDAVFVKIATADGEFTSAVTAPSLPVEFSGVVLGVMGLQPHIRMHHKLSSSATHPNIVTQAGKQYLAPSDILTAYNAPAALTGAGQTIAIIVDATVASSDLQLFYSTVGSTQVPGNVTTILVNGGPTSSADADEAALDVEWASGMAPGAKIRLYATSDLSDVSLQAALNRINADAAANNITVLGMSFAGAEDPRAASSLIIFSQNFAQIAAANITTLCSSGDGGSNPNPNSPGDYAPGNPLVPEYPASDPNVAGVGGTLLTLASNSFYVSESVFNATSSGHVFASGGGVSTVFSRPSWQTDGGSVLSNNSMRCVPDVSTIWQGSTTGALVIRNGTFESIGGTSLSCQVWAGIAALLNQARANAGMGPIGVLGPAIYPLHGTSSFNDVMSGNNGAYSAGFGYDLCTGLGSPNIANLANALTGAIPLGSINAGTTQAGGGGGGGAPSLWFYGALTLVVSARRAFRLRKADR